MAGIWDLLIDVAVYAVTNHTETGKKINKKVTQSYNDTSNKYNSQYDNALESAKRWSDDELKRRYRNSTSDIDKSAYAQEIKNRGLF